MNIVRERLKNGIIKENPTFVQVLGMCPTLAVTTSAKNGLGMGLATTAVLICSNMVISLVRKLIPSKIRIPSFIVIIATFVTIIEFLLEGYAPSLYDSLGLFIPLIVVNCIILGRAEAYASKHSVIASLFDGLGTGLGFTLSLTMIGIIRELLGTGKFFSRPLLPASFEPAIIMIMAPGAFFTLGILMALLNQYRLQKGKN
ncbi:MAG: electron transport complex subunit E [Epulopiscium sp.]|mgnify:CR=1 FL=1|nr:electron transport complex subunit E [Candidatus Epulonipiscium sp.]